jgi:hydroxyacylglutathione hydrolase
VIVEHLAVGPLLCNCTIVADERRGDAIVVDGGDGVDDVLATLRRRGLRATHLLHTHAHIDHIGDAGRLRDETSARAFLHPGDLPLYEMLDWQARLLGLPHAPAVVRLDGELADGVTFRSGNVTVEVLHTPGHTPGSVSFSVREDDATLLLTGDTLFAGAIGRWDIGGTSMEDIVDSINRKLLVFPDETPVMPGHGPSTTIGVERRSNPYLQAR